MSIYHIPCPYHLVIPVLIVIGLSENQREHHACVFKVLGLGSSCIPSIPDDASGRLPCAELFAAGYQVSASLCIDCSLLMVAVCFLPAHCPQTQDAGSSRESSIDASQGPGGVGSCPQPGGMPCTETQGDAEKAPSHTGWALCLHRLDK